MEITSLIKRVNVTIESCIENCGSFPRSKEYWLTMARGAKYAYEMIAIEYGGTKENDEILAAASYEFKQMIERAEK